MLLELRSICSLSINYQIKKEGWGGGGTRTLKFIRDDTCKDVSLKINGKACAVMTPPGLANTTRKLSILKFLHHKIQIT